MERSVLLAATLTLAASWESTVAQCGPVHSCPGIYGFVDASTMWDPDGPGPHVPQAIFAGRFDFAGDVRAANIAMWDPATGLWSSLGAGVHGEEGRIRALSTTAAGDLVVGGDFLFAGNSVCRNVARWDGNAWHAFGGGIDGQVAALAMLPTGDIVAAGNFVTASGTTLNHIGRWNGTTWSPLGGGLSARATAMAVLPGGGLAVFGHFQTAGTTTAPGAAVWNGTTWTALPPTAPADSRSN